MAHHDRGVVIDEKIAHWRADDFAATYHHGYFAFDFDSSGFDQFDAAAGRARNVNAVALRFAARQFAGVQRRQSAREKRLCIYKPCLQFDLIHPSTSFKGSMMLVQ